LKFKKFPIVAYDMVQIGTLLKITKIMFEITAQQLSVKSLDTSPRDIIDIFKLLTF